MNISQASHDVTYSLMCISLFTIGRKYVKFLAWAQYKKKIKDRKHKHLMPRAEANPSDNSKKKCQHTGPTTFFN